MRIVSRNILKETRNNTFNITDFFFEPVYARDPSKENSPAKKENEVERKMSVQGLIPRPSGRADNPDTPHDVERRRGKEERKFA